MDASADAVARFEKHDGQARVFKKRRQRQACDARADDRDIDASLRHALWTRNPWRRYQLEGTYRALALTVSKTRLGAQPSS